MKLLGYIIIGTFLLFCLGSFVAPFAAMLWFVATHSLAEIIKGGLILYIISIPVGYLLEMKRRADQG